MKECQVIFPFLLCRGRFPGPSLSTLRHPICYGSWGNAYVSWRAGSRRCPVLCLWGEEDTVLPVSESVVCIQHALQASVHHDWTVRTFPKANHLLYLNRASVDEQANEAMHEQLHDIQFPAGLFELMTMWASQRLQQP
jgi:pimeloyl-ACP methyl ester carboxylesterase